MMKLSVALCSYNGAEYIAAQLKSIASQTRLPDELIICDDASTDNTIKIIKSFASQVSFPVYLHCNETNMGSTKNFEKAISLCTGDIIALSDQDDIWHQKKLKRIMDVFEARPEIGAVFTDADVVDESLKPVGYSLWTARNFSRSEQRSIKQGKALHVLFRHYVVTGATLAFRSFYKKLLLPIDTNWVHDGWIALLIAAVADIDIIKEPLIRYRHHQQQQIGVKQQNLKSKIYLAAKRDRSGYKKQLRQYEAAYQRLLAAPEYNDRNKLKHIEQKIQHIRARSVMPANRLKRIPAVLKEIVRLRYHRCSYGITSALRDLLFIIFCIARIIEGINTMSYM